MNTHIAFCSACDHDVRVAITDAPVYSDQAPLEGGEVVCLDFGDRCTGSMCPMFGLPRILMAVRLARSGLRPDAFRTLRGPCQECGTVGDLKVLDASIAYCEACGSRSRMVRLRVGEDDYIALAGVTS
jgi:hypothetical protein